MSTELPSELRIRDQPRRFKLHAVQWIGLPIIFGVPILALLGVFGESRVQVEGQGEELAISVEYATRYRYKQIEKMQVFVRNRSDATIDTAVVAFDPEYAQHFSTLMFIPSAREPFIVELLDLGPGEERRVWAEFQGEGYGRHRGSIEAYRPGSRDTARVVVHTLIYP